MLAANHLILAATASPFAPGWNGQARTPPMGWRSWNAFGPAITQDMMLSAATAIAAKNRTVKGWDGKVSLCDIGYCSVGVDEGWEGCGAGVNGTQHDAQGVPTIDDAFPDTGAMVRSIHGLGLKAGWYLNGCKCGERTEVLKNYVGDIESLHSFGFDGVKIDGCGAQKNQTLYAELMKASGRNYTIENCREANQPPSPAAPNRPVAQSRNRSNGAPLKLAPRCVVRGQTGETARAATTRRVLPPLGVPSTGTGPPGTSTRARRAGLTTSRRRHASRTMTRRCRCPAAGRIPTCAPASRHERTHPQACAK